MRAGIAPLSKMLKKEDALLVECFPRINGSTRKVYVFKCKELSCNEKVRCRSDSLLRYSGYCKSHVQKKRPFESIYMGLYNDHRKIPVDLTYEDFLSFTKITKCYYCLSNIPWQEYAFVEGKYTSRAYFLDRKVNSLPYSKQNCVVCCTHCNKMKSNLDHDDFIVKCNLIAGTFNWRFMNSLKRSNPPT